MAGGITTATLWTFCTSLEGQRMLNETDLHEHYEQLKKEDQERADKKFASLQQLLDEQQSLIQSLNSIQIKIAAKLAGFTA